MKKIGLLMVTVLMALSSCIKQIDHDPRCYYWVQNEQIMVADTSAVVQCDFTIGNESHPSPSYPNNANAVSEQGVFFVYGESETDRHDVLMEVVETTQQYEERVDSKLRVALRGLKPNTTYNYYYVCRNGFDSIWTETKSFKTEAGNGGGEEPPTPPEIMLPTVITAAVTEITTNSAQCGGEVINDGGATVTERGICWSLNTNPTFSDSHVAAGTGTGAFASTISGLESNTTYYVRAYAINSVGTGYGEDEVFTTLSSGGGGGGDHEFVDLGLPSGLLWATCNVGANAPEEYGNYYAWGETQPKEYYYNWSNYQHCLGDYDKLTKYCNLTAFGYNGFTDNLITLLPEDDAATVNWGNNWRMPSQDEFYELIINTTQTLSTQNGVHGVLFTASNGNSIFLPGAGSQGSGWEGGLGGEGSGYYWSSTLDPEHPFHAFHMHCSADWYYLDLNCYCIGNNRHFGHSVRPVRPSN